MKSQYLSFIFIVCLYSYANGQYENDTLQLLHKYSFVLDTSQQTITASFYYDLNIDVYAVDYAHGYSTHLLHDRMYQAIKAWKVFCDSLGKIDNVKTLYLNMGPCLMSLNDLEKGLLRQKKLENIIIYNTFLGIYVKQELPLYFTKLNHLKYLYCSDLFTDIPKWLPKLRQLEVFEWEDSNPSALTTFPMQLLKMKKLKRILIHPNMDSNWKMPSGIKKLSNLERLCIFPLNYDNYPFESIKCLKHLKELTWPLPEEMMKPYVPNDCELISPSFEPDHFWFGTPLPFEYPY